MNAAKNVYTPTTEQVRDGYAHSYLGDGSEMDEEDVVAEQLPEFDRWLADHDAAVRDAALEEAAVLADQVRVNAEQFGYDGIAEATTAALLADSIRDARAEESKIPPATVTTLAKAIRAWGARPFVGLDLRAEEIKLAEAILTEFTVAPLPKTASDRTPEASNA